MATILEHFSTSLLVTTYQAGRLVILASNSGLLNTHFVTFNKPMGLALAPGRIAVGCESDICEFHNAPAVARKLEPPALHDACFLPRVSHVTGDVQIHEMAWLDNELWFINTRFSCLCTRSHNHSFTPRWKPSFITQLTPDDRCHLNGLCVVDGQIRYLTALGETDTAAGWRQNKRSGGILIDAVADRIVARNLSMPHSPRWHRNKLWVLNSGEGGFGTIDQRDGTYHNMVTLPGFTRGLDFVGQFAFIGLSQVRESAIFSDIGIAQRPVQDRSCGVWVVDIDAGCVAGFIRFEAGVQEVFAVQSLRSRYPTIINNDVSLLNNSFILPDAAVRQVPDSLLPIPNSSELHG